MKNDEGGKGVTEPRCIPRRTVSMEKEKARPEKTDHARKKKKKGENEDKI